MPQSDQLALYQAPIPVLRAHSLEAYVHTINKIPLLSTEEEMLLAKRLTEQNDVEAARQLVLAHLRYVVYIARQYMGYGLGLADLIQEGNVGLMKAVKKFDINKGVRLVAYASYWIKESIHEYLLKNWRIVKIATTKAQRKLFFSKSALMNEGEDSTRVEHLNKFSETLGVSTQVAEEMQKRLSQSDTSFGMTDEDGFAPESFLSRASDQPDMALEKKQEQWLHTEGLHAALGQLDERSRYVLEARFLRNETDTLTLHELARELNISAERVRQIEVAAIKKLKKQLSAYILH